MRGQHQIRLKIGRYEFIITILNYKLLLKDNRIKKALKEIESKESIVRY
jgi:hypothetical protein